MTKKQEYSDCRGKEDHELKNLFNTIVDEIE